MKPPKFALESDLCAAFLAWLSKAHPDVKAFAEWDGWDILLVYPEGWQIGVQAKLRLNADVILQAAPSVYDDGIVGPDYRAVLVPDANGYAQVARLLGLIVFTPRYRDVYHGAPIRDFLPGLRDGLCDGQLSSEPPADWCDWNPTRRHKLPPVPTDAVAGSPCPVTLTPWKLGALDVLAELEVCGTITAKRIRRIGIDPRRWTQNRWIVPGDKRGDWTRGADCPRFDAQHPTAYAEALTKARAATTQDQQEATR